MILFIDLTIFILGSAIGSFLNVLIDRLPNDESINGRSHCDHCKKKIAWYDLIPVLSFFILGGKTRCCGKKLSFQYPVIEFVTGIIFVMVFKDGPYLGPSLIRSVLISGIMACFIVIFVSDLKYHLISDYVMLVLFAFSAIFKFVQNPACHSGLSRIGFWSRCAPQNDVMAALIVSFPIFLIYFISKEKAMGLGDVYLSAIMGFLLGWQAGFLALYIAFVTGAIYGLFLILLKKKKIKSKIPFGPFLVIGTIIMLFFSDKVLQLISSIYRF